MRTYYFWGLALVVSLVGCLSTLDTDFESERFPVISGVITNSTGQRIIRVAEISDLSLEARQLQATGQIFEDGEAIADLEVLAPGQLKMPDQVQLTAGKAYHIEVITEEGEVFQTTPQTVLAHNPAGYQLSFEREIRINAFNEGQEEDGLPRSANLPYWVDILIDIPSDSGASYFRWEIAETYLFKESPKPRVDTLTYFDSTFVLGIGWIYDTTIVVEEDPIKSCYLNIEVEENPSLVASTSGLNQTGTSIRVFTRPVDQTFINQHYFRVYTHRLDQEAYEFYAKNQQLIAFQGQLYDEIPAGVDGNVFEVADPTRRVLGFVEFSLADTTRISEYQNDMGIELLDDCRPAPGDPVFCERLDLDPCKCWDCDSLYGKETLIRPVWFN